MSTERRPLGAAARKARLARAFLAGEPVHCTWQLSPRCESLCHLCEHRQESAAEELDAEASARVAEALGRRTSLLVSFTGAEPFLRHDLPAIVSAVATWHFPLLVTNGWLVSARRAREVWTAGLQAASVALEDADADRHDERAGQRGAFDRGVAALGTLARERVRRGQQVTIRTRVRDGDLAPLERLLRLADRHGATVSVEAAYPLPVLDGEARGLAERLRHLKRQHPHLRTADHALDGLARAVSGGVPGCLAARAFFNVDHRGRVSRCLEFRGPADRLATLPGEAAALPSRLRAASQSNDCRACWYASRSEVEALYTLRGFLAGVRTLVTT